VIVFVVAEDANLNCAGRRDTSHRTPSRESMVFVVRGGREPRGARGASATTAVARAGMTDEGRRPGSDERVRYAWTPYPLDVGNHGSGTVRF